MKHNLPIVYKYRDTSDRTLKIIQENHLFFPNSTSFNDPFDGQVISCFEGTEAQWFEFLCNAGLPETEAKAVAARLKDKALDDAALKHEKIGTPIENRVLCLAAKPNDILMWSHYADSHKGVCLGFKTESMLDSTGLLFEPNQLAGRAADIKKVAASIPDGYLPFFKVKYQVQRPAPYNGLIHDGRQIVEFMQTKHQSWSYEDEVRIHMLDAWMKNNPLKFKKEILTEVIFGMKMSDSDKQKFRDVIQTEYIAKGFSVTIKTATAHPRDFAIEIT